MAAAQNGVGQQAVECPLRVTSRLHGHCVDTSAPRAEADVIGGKADVEIEGLLSARERTFSVRASMSAFGGIADIPEGTDNVRF